MTTFIDSAALSTSAKPSPGSRPRRSPPGVGSHGIGGRAGSSRALRSLGSAVGSGWLGLWLIGLTPSAAAAAEGSDADAEIQPEAPPGDPDRAVRDALTAGASEDGSDTTSQARSGRRKSASRGRASGRRRVSLQDEFLVEGQLDKPSAYYILRRSHDEYDWARMDAKFLPLVLESIQDPLF